MTKVRLTGGEPLLRRDLPSLIARLTAIEGIEDLALTTNGTLLARQAVALRQAGLRRITVSMDALEPALFRRMSGDRGEIAQVLTGIAAAEQAGFQRLKINCVVQRGVNEDQVLPLVEHFRGTGHVLRFIEFMDVGSCNGWTPDAVVTSAQLHERIHARWPLVALDANYTGKWPSATPSRMAPARWASSVRSASRSAAIASVRAFRQTGICIPACSPARGMTSPALANGEPALATHLRQRWSVRGDRYSEVRASVPRRGKPVEMF